MTWLTNWAVARRWSTPIASCKKAQAPTASLPPTSALVASKPSLTSLLKRPRRAFCRKRRRQKHNNRALPRANPWPTPGRNRPPARGGPTLREDVYRPRARTGHPQGVALLYARGRPATYIVGPPLAGGLRSSGGRNTIDLEYSHWHV